MANAISNFPKPTIPLQPYCDKDAPTPIHSDSGKSGSNSKQNYRHRFAVRLKEVKKWLTGSSGSNDPASPCQRDQLYLPDAPSEILSSRRSNSVSALNEITSSLRPLPSPPVQIPVSSCISIPSSDHRQRNHSRSADPEGEMFSVNKHPTLQSSSAQDLSDHLYFELVPDEPDTQQPESSTADASTYNPVNPAPVRNKAPYMTSGAHFDAHVLREKIPAIPKLKHYNLEACTAHDFSTRQYVQRPTSSPLHSIQPNTPAFNPGISAQLISSPHLQKKGNVNDIKTNLLYSRHAHVQRQTVSNHTKYINSQRYVPPGAKHTVHADHGSQSRQCSASPIPFNLSSNQFCDNDTKFYSPLRETGESSNKVILYNCLVSPGSRPAYPILIYFNHHVARNLLRLSNLAKAKTKYKEIEIVKRGDHFNQLKKLATDELNHLEAADIQDIIDLDHSTHYQLESIPIVIASFKGISKKRDLLPLELAIIPVNGFYILFIPKKLEAALSYGSELPQPKTFIDLDQLLQSQSVTRLIKRVENRRDVPKLIISIASSGPDKSHKKSTGFDYKTVFV